MLRRDRARGRDAGCRHSAQPRAPEPGALLLTCFRGPCPIRSRISGREDGAGASSVEISDGSVARAGDGGLDARLAAAHVFLEFPLFCRPRLFGRLLAIGVGIFYTGGSGRVNLLSPLPDTAIAERVETLVVRPGLRIERIVSCGQASPPGFWYDQAEAEWVTVLAGSARLRFADETEARVLAPGDWVDIAAHRRHRVEWTDLTVPTVGLAVFYR